MKGENSDAIKNFNGRAMGEDDGQSLTNKTSKENVEWVEKREEAMGILEKLKGQNLGVSGWVDRDGVEKDVGLRMASDGDLAGEKMEGYGYDYFSSEEWVGEGGEKGFGVDRKKVVLEDFERKINCPSYRESQDTPAEHWSELDAKDQDVLVPEPDSKQQPESEIFRDGDDFSPTSNKQPSKPDNKTSQKSESPKTPQDTEPSQFDAEDYVVRNKNQEKLDDLFQQDSTDKYTKSDNDNWGDSDKVLSDKIDDEEFRNMRFGGDQGFYPGHGTDRNEEEDSTSPKRPPLMFTDIIGIDDIDEVDMGQQNSSGEELRERTHGFGENQPVFDVFEQFDLKYNQDQQQGRKEGQENNKNSQGKPRPDNNPYRTATMGNGYADDGVMDGGMASGEWDYYED